MKKIEAIIRTFKLDDVKDALGRIGISGITVTEVRGVGRQWGRIEGMDMFSTAGNLMSKVKLEIIVPDRLVELVLETIINSARTGRPGDGKIFVMDVEEAVRIRTGEVGDEACL
ncbi:MAG: P-II family nitrogen regulator [Thermosulfidibacteraceae bacterium]|jgi:nitrogen regulatory protein P-II 1